MTSNRRILKARELWIRCYKEVGFVSIAARKCGIPKSTLYRWVKRVKLQGYGGLKRVFKTAHYFFHFRPRKKIELNIFITPLYSINNITFG
jgi:predicted transcriptional regulator